MDSHTAYVALSRHRDSVALSYGQEDFADQGKLVRTLSRERGKDMASDYARDAEPDRAFAERRGITFRERVVEAVKAVVPERVRSMFDGLRLSVPKPGPSVSTTDLERLPANRAGLEPAVSVRSDAALNKAAVERHARAVEAIFVARREGQSLDTGMLDELNGARAELNGRRPDGALDMETAYRKDPSLARDAASGNPFAAAKAMQHETELRTGAAKRADLFVERWNQLSKGAERAYQDGDVSSQKSIRGEMANAPERDPQMESILANRKLEIGIEISTGRSLGAELAFNHGINLGRGLEIGM